MRTLEQVGDRAGRQGIARAEAGPRIFLEGETEGRDPLRLGLELIGEGRHLEADRVLTAAILERADDPDVWLAAGLARMGRGACRSAACAFRMCAWLSGDGAARELAAAVGGR